ncbi:MAG: hypothetical protein KF752_12970 [Pirellulaceae bacterium]|nr:hypothetical protein [Pirellulaceae bacterium]
MVQINGAAHSTLDANDAQQAMWIAYSGMEHCIATLSNNPNWRSTYSNGTPISQITIGNGTFTWKLVDSDGNLSDDANDHVTVIATGKVGTTTRVLKQDLEPTGQGFDVLQTVVHSSDKMEVYSANIWGGKFSSNVRLKLPSENVLTGNNQGIIAQGTSIDIKGTLIGGTSATFPNAMAMPADSVFESYLSRAAMLDYATVTSGQGFSGKLITSQFNPWGTPSPDGIYAISVPSNGLLTIANCRIRATLLIALNSGSALRVTNNVIWEAPSNRQPANITKASSKGNTIEFDGTGTLIESAWSINFNPPGTPYRNSQNANTTDCLPATLRGLFHIIRPSGDSTETLIKGDLPHSGCFLIKGGALIQGTHFTNNMAIWQEAPIGYIAAPIMRPRQSTMSWEPTN